MIGVMKGSLGSDVIAAIAMAKAKLRRNQLRQHSGYGLISAQAGRRGASFFEADVGEVMLGGPFSKRGRRRLVFLVQSGQIKEMYFTDDHYRPGSWRRILNF